MPDLSPQAKPLVEFDPSEPSAVIRFDIPLPSSFDYNLYLDLDVKDTEWAPYIRSQLAALRRPANSTLTAEDLRSTIASFPRRLRDLMPNTLGSFKVGGNANPINRLPANTKINLPKRYARELINSDNPNDTYISADELRRISIEKDLQFGVRKSLTGLYTVSGSVQAQAYHIGPPRLAVVERYVLEIYLGNYGTGKTISSFFVHPKSSVDLTIKSWTRTTESYEASSSIFDSLTENASSDFQTSFEAERSKSQERSSQSEYYAEASASASFAGFGASAKAGTKGSSSNARSDFAKDVRNTVNSHAAERSAVREKEQTVSTESQREEGEETTLVRKIENINAGHVLNFLVKELNQEYHYAQVFKDIRLLVSWGSFVDEVPLYDIDEFLKKYLDQQEVKPYRDFILKEYSYIKKFDGKRESVFQILKYSDDKPANTNIEQAIENFDPNKHYIAIPREKCGIGKRVGGRAAGREIEVEGVPIDVSTVSMKTDGVVCSALLDPGRALDAYSLSMQEVTRDKARVEVDRNRTEVLLHELARELVQTGDDAKIGRFEKVVEALRLLHAKPNNE